MATQESGGIQLETLLRPLPRGFLAESNTKGVEALGKYLGLEFRTQPQDVILNARNRLLICLVHRDLAPKPLLYFLLGIRRNNIDTGGWYLIKYHATFVWRDDIDSLDAKYLHETMHSYTFQENPKIVKQALADSSLVYKAQGSDISSSLIDREIARSFIGEGIAEWGASEIRFRQSRLPQVSVFEGDELIRQRFNEVRSPFSSQEQWLRDIVPVGRERFQYALSLNGKKRKSELKEADKYFKHFYYIQGWLFVQDVLRYMINRGLSTQEALNSLIQGMPERIEQIQDAFDLAESLLP